MLSIPHASGGDPDLVDDTGLAPWYSPRKWG